MSNITDADIELLIGQQKQVTTPNAKEKTERSAVHKNYTVTPKDSTNIEFNLYTRQNCIDSDSYSAGLVLIKHPSLAVPITLVRYNGSNHEHSNHIEGDVISFKEHVHKATARYVDAGKKADGYAYACDRYSSLETAFECLLLDCNIELQQPYDKDRLQLPLAFI